MSCPMSTSSSSAIRTRIGRDTEVPTSPHSIFDIYRVLIPTLSARPAWDSRFFFSEIGNLQAHASRVDLSAHTILLPLFLFMIRHLQRKRPRRENDFSFSICAFISTRVKASKSSGR